MVKLLLFICLPFLISVYALDGQDKSLTPENVLSLDNATSLMETGSSLTVQHWDSLRSMVKSGNADLLAILEAANPKTVNQILSLLQSLIQKNVQTINKYNTDLKSSHDLFKKSQSGYNNVVTKLNAKRKQIRLLKREQMIIKKKLIGAQGEVGMLKRNMAQKQALMNLAMTGYRDAKNSRNKNVKSLTQEIALIRTIIAMVKKLIPCPTGWAGFGKMCYRAFENKSVKWLQAEANCRNFNKGHLAKITKINNVFLFKNIIRGRPGVFWGGNKKCAVFVSRRGKKRFYGVVSSCTAKHHYICQMPVP